MDAMMNISDEHKNIHLKIYTRSSGSVIIQALNNAMKLHVTIIAESALWFNAIFGAIWEGGGGGGGR